MRLLAPAAREDGASQKCDRQCLERKLSRRLFDKGKRTITRRRYGLHLTFPHAVRGFALADFLDRNRACTFIRHGRTPNLHRYSVKVLDCSSGLLVAPPDS